MLKLSLGIYFERQSKGHHFEVLTRSQIEAADILTLSKQYVLVTEKLHPASKALRIMAELVVGVAEARPKGFSNLSPHISTLTSTSSIGVKNLGSSGSDGT